MKIIGFRIRDYKLIADTGEWSVDGGVTILLGKNETGKSSVLEAISGLDMTPTWDQGCLPLQSNTVPKPKSPRVDVKIKYEKHEADKLGTLSTGLRKTLKENDNRLELNFDNGGVYLNSLKKEGKSPTYLNELQHSLNMRDWIPEIKYINELNAIPDDIQFGDTAWMYDLFYHMGIPINNFRGTMPHQITDVRKQINNGVDTTLNSVYLEFWHDLHGEFSVVDSPSGFHFGIKENKMGVELSKRGDGRKQITKIVTHLVPEYKDRSIMFLLDEPDRYLHPQWQRGLSQFFSLIGMSPNKQIMFSTHSTHMPEYDRLERIRVLSRSEEQGVVIKDKAHHPPGNVDTVTHLLQTAGMEVDNCLFPFGFANNIIVEGISDKYYLEGFHEYYAKKLSSSPKKPLAFISGGGAANMIPAVASVLRGWGARVLFVFDKDDEGKKGARKVARSDWNKEDIIFVSEDSGKIENLFSTNDRRKHVAPNKGDKEDYSKNFSLICKSGDFPKLTKITERKIVYVFDRIYDRLSDIKH